MNINFTCQVPIQKYNDLVARNGWGGGLICPIFGNTSNVYMPNLKLSNRIELILKSIVNLTDEEIVIVNGILNNATYKYDRRNNLKIYYNKKEITININDIQEYSSYVEFTVEIKSL